MNGTGEHRPDLGDEYGHRLGVECIDAHAISQCEWAEARCRHKLSARAAIASDDLNTGQGYPIRMAPPVDELIEDHTSGQREDARDSERDVCHVMSLPSPATGASWAGTISRYPGRWRAASGARKGAEVERDHLRVIRERCPGAGIGIVSLIKHIATVHDL